MRRLIQHLLFHFIVYGVTIPEILMDRVVFLGESPTKRAFCNCIIIKVVPNNDGHVDLIRHLLRNDNFT